MEIRTMLGRLRKRRRGIRITGYDFMSEAKSERLITNNNIVDNHRVSDEIYRIDPYNARNVILVEYNHGKRTRIEPCPNRESGKVTRGYRKINKRLARVEGF